MHKKRYGTVAALLSLVAPGTGFLYAGWWKLGLLIPVLLFAVITIIGGTRFILSSWGLYAIFLVVALAYFISILVSFFLARRSHITPINKGQRWYIYILFILGSFLIAAQLFGHRNSFLGYRVHLLPSSSMANTLLPHDYIMVDTWAYRNKQPQRGDVVIFKYPPKPDVLFIKRIVAVGGDRVRLDQGRLLVNGAIQAEPYVLANYNKKTSHIQYQEWLVPANHYFVLGDNRDNSNDSRYWGMLKREAINGKAMSIWFSYGTKGGFKIRGERLDSLYN